MNKPKLKNKMEKKQEIRTVKVKGMNLVIAGVITIAVMKVIDMCIKLGGMAMVVKALKKFGIDILATEEEKQ